MAWNGQFVWPKDRQHKPRGFFRGLGDVFTGKGPDIYMMKKGSKSPIPTDQWSNWDTYHLPEYLVDELKGGGLFNARRTTKRYDPQSRRYVDWTPSQLPPGLDPYMMGCGDENNYPRFTEKEFMKMARHHMRHGKLPARGGKGWDEFGPQRFRPRHDTFWQNAHRKGENMRDGLHPDYQVNPYFTMAQQHPEDVERWYTNTWTGGPPNPMFFGEGPMCF